MPDKNAYQALLRSKVAAAIEQARAAASFTHQGVKGSVLEILVSKIFKPLLPGDIGVGTGQVIDAYGTEMSGQIDIVLYDRSILPPILVDEKTGIFPVESVLYAIEVKTTLDSTGISTAHAAAEKLSKFGYLPGMQDELGKDKNHPVERIRSVIFALGSDLTGTGLTEADRYKKVYKNDPAHIRAICVVDSGYWYDDGDRWIGPKSVERYDEILSFIGGVTNTYKGVSNSRHDPRLGHYVIPEGKEFSVIESRKVPRLKVACDKCGKQSELKPNIGKMNLTVDGSISAKEPCPDCGGTFRTEPGKYKFENGELVREG